MSLDRATLRELGELTDEVGVLSIYLNRDPQSRNTAGATTPYQLRLRQQLSQLREQLKETGPREHWKALVDRLGQLEPDFAQLLDPTSTGQGAVLFATVATGEVRTIFTQVPLTDQVVLESRAYLRPLITAWSTDGPAGAVTIDEDTLKIVDLRFGLAEPVGAIPVLYEGGEQRELKGPATSNPAMMQRNAPQHDLYERREDDKLLRFLRTVGPQLAEHITTREWGYAALTGDPALVQAVRDGLPPQLPAEVITLDHPVSSLPVPKLAATVAPALARARRRRHLALASQARDNALSANAGAFGLGETLSALQQGRVAHLLLTADGQWAGSRTPQGWLVPAGELPPGADPATLAAEPRLAERMIELAFRADAQVTALTPEEADPLAEADGIGAILRW